MESVSKEVVKSLQLDGNKILVDFFAQWCGPCKVLIPKLEEIEKNYPNVKFVKVDVDENMQFAIELGIRGVPTVMIFDGEQLLDSTSGVQSDQHYKQILDKL